MSNKINLKSLSKEDIYLFVENNDLPKYRADQLIHWIYEKYAADIDEITEFSVELRSSLKKVAYISNLGLVKRLKSSDGTKKFLFSLEDGETIESVLIPDEGRLTLCISSQVGCAMGCLFCLTAKCGLVRSLKSYEILDQITIVNRIMQNERFCLHSKKNEQITPHTSPLEDRHKGEFPGRKVTNIVFMGMGEPLANFDEVVEAIRRIVRFFGISKRKITLSTAGIVPKILLLAERAPDVNLAVSLNAATDEVRREIMPITKRYPLRSLINACKRYPLRPGRRITFEYVLIDGKNDSTEDARRLMALLKGIRCKINLIPLNPFEGSEFKRPSDKRVLEFQKILLQGRMRTLIRESRGQDILAACGQLRGGHGRSDEGK
jgi:23S rRNA (adenine2503-C2)-methyltransferase